MSRWKERKKRLRDWRSERQQTRVRRGKVVEVPARWVGHVAHPQTIRKRPSKHLHKLRKEVKYGGRRVPKPAERSADYEDPS